MLSTSPALSAIVAVAVVVWVVGRLLSERTAMREMKMEDWTGEGGTNNNIT